jgi:D-serine deaminase-like pyridoxal phosphate-dependent protein
VREARERSAQIARTVEAVKETQAALKAVGLVAATVTGAGTGTYENEAASTVYTELQAGSYIFMDADYARNKRGNGEPFDTFEHALFVQATVMSVRSPDRLVIDAGLKAFAIDSGMPAPWRMPGAIYHRPSDERGAATRCSWSPATAIPPSTCTIGTWGCAGWAPLRHASRACGRWRRGARCSDSVRAPFAGSE